MKLFRFVRNFLTKIGLIQPIDRSHKQHCPFNFKLIFILICIIQLAISTMAFFLYEATTLGERAESLYTFISELVCIINYLVIILIWPKMVKSIEKFEQFIEKSEFWTFFHKNKIEICFYFVIGPSTKSISYDKLNEKIELTTKVIHFILFKLTFIGAIIPALLLTIINHFIYHLGDESFILPISAMYVFTAWIFSLNKRTYVYFSSNIWSNLSKGCQLIGKHHLAIASPYSSKVCKHMRWYIVHFHQLPYWLDNAGSWFAHAKISKIIYQF